MRIRLITLCLGLSVTPCFALTAHADAGCNVTVLQDPGGLGDSSPFFNAINDFGWSVGFSATAGLLRGGAVVTDREGDGASRRWRPEQQQRGRHQRLRVERWNFVGLERPGGGVVVADRESAADPRWYARQRRPRHQ
jgi:hypothetical protein